MARGFDEVGYRRLADMFGADWLHGAIDRKLMRDMEAAQNAAKRREEVYARMNMEGPGGSVNVSSGIPSFGDFFDNSKWSTIEVEAAPKRGGMVERRVFNEPQSEATVAAAAPVVNSKEAEVNAINEAKEEGGSTFSVMLDFASGLGGDMMDSARKARDAAGAAIKAADESDFGRIGQDMMRKYTDAYGGFRKMQDAARGVSDDIAQGEGFDAWLAQKYNAVDDFSRKMREMAEKVQIPTGMQMSPVEKSMSQSMLGGGAYTVPFIKGLKYLYGLTPFGD